MTALSADRPSTDPEDDLFGHAPFAKNLADSICRYPSSDGLVLALYGPWGSGKSTVLNFVRHYYLEQKPEHVVAEFNPWWFSGQEDLARAFLGQLQAVLPTRSEEFKERVALLGEFAEGIGGVIDLSGMTGGAGGWLGKLFGKVAKRKPKDVPALKAEISKILREAGKRILVVIDDIDRLTPEETRQLFTVIKALADFPNVVYLLALDRNAAVQAIEHQSGLPGERYLEKIIQATFELPLIDRVELRAALFKRLDEVLGDVADGLFDQSYWENVYHDGIDPLMQTPRDVVRFTNTLSVTYPPVRGEVNPVDFIALESLRVFLPVLYDTVRTNPERFLGLSRGYLNDLIDEKQNSAQVFLEQCMKEVPETLRASTQAMLERIFPEVVDLSSYRDEWLAESRRNLRACHPDVFPIHFRFSVPPGAVSYSDMMALLGLAGAPEDFGNALIRAKEVKHPCGLSKAQALLERLMDHVEKDIPDANIPSVIQALLNIGDALIDPADERGMFDVVNVARASRPAYHLLKRVAFDQRTGMLESALQSGNAVAVQFRLLKRLDEEETTKPKGSGENTLMAADNIERLKAVWLDRVRELSREASFLDHPELPRLLAAWRHWASEAEVRAWCDRAFASDEGLLKLLQRSLRYESFQTLGDRAVRRQPRLNPSRLEVYIDTATCAERLQAIQCGNEVPAGAQEAVSQYLTEFEMLQSGKNPDDISAFDD